MKIGGCQNFEIGGFLNDSTMIITVFDEFMLYDKPIHVLYINKDFRNPYFIAEEVTFAMGYKDLARPIRRIISKTRSLRTYDFPIVIDGGKPEIRRFIDRSMLYLLACKSRNSEKFVEELHTCTYPKLDLIMGSFELGTYKVFDDD